MMDHQQIAQRATSARTAFDEWVTAQIARDPTIDPLALVNQAFLDLTQDGTFVRDWVLATMQDHIAGRIARHGRAYDVPSSPVVSIATAKPAPNGGAGGRGPARYPAQTQAKRPKAPNAWRSWLATEKAPRRTKLMRRDDLVAIVAAERQEAATHAMNARLAETLLARMPADRPDVQVGDVWTDEELREAVRASLAPAPIAAIPDATDRLEAV